MECFLSAFFYICVLTLLGVFADSLGGRVDGVGPGDLDGHHPGNNNNHHGGVEGEPTFSDDEEAEENDIEHEVEESEQAAGSLVRTLRRLSQDDDEDEDIPLGKLHRILFSFTLLNSVF